MNDDAETKIKTDDHNFSLGWVIAMVACTMLLAVLLAYIKPWA
jgi:hypothetical protein